MHIYAFNIGLPKYRHQILIDIKGDTDSNTIILETHLGSVPFRSMDRPSRQIINKEMLTLNNTLNQMDLIDIHRTFHPKTPEYTFFSSAHGTFSRLAHILSHKTISVNVRRLKSSLPAQHCETRNQLQGEKEQKTCKKYKHIEANQYVTK